MAAASIQNQINPPTSVFNKSDFSAAKVDDPTKPVTPPNPNQTDFRALITNSMDEIKKQRAAKENGDLTASSDEEFLQKLADQTKEKRVPKNELGKDDFLKLFVTQLQNQDPLNPDDGTEMAAKLAQFNGLEQMMNVNKSLEKMLTDQNSARNLQLVNYVGREVTIDGGRVRLKDGLPTKSEFQLESEAAAATLEVRDSTGIMVAQMDLGTMSPGNHPLKWDGKSSTGRTLPDGVYTYSIAARNVDGQTIPVTMTAKARITGIDIKSQDGALYSDYGKIKFDDIRSVGRPGFDEDAAAAKASASSASANVGEDLDRLKAEGKLKLPGNNQEPADSKPQATQASLNQAPQAPASPSGPVNTGNTLATSPSNAGGSTPQAKTAATNPEPPLQADVPKASVNTMSAAPTAASAKKKAGATTASPSAEATPKPSRSATSVKDEAKAATSS
jgi:flagellar basal-body rod modification protein FlgD